MCFFTNFQTGSFSKILRNSPKFHLSWFSDILRGIEKDQIELIRFTPIEGFPFKNIIMKLMVEILLWHKQRSSISLTAIEYLYICFFSKLCNGFFDLDFKIFSEGFLYSTISDDFKLYPPSLCFYGISKREFQTNSLVRIKYFMKVHLLLIWNCWKEFIQETRFLFHSYLNLTMNYKTFKWINKNNIKTWCNIWLKKSIQSPSFEIFITGSNNYDEYLFLCSATVST